MHRDCHHKAVLEIPMVLPDINYDLHPCPGMDLVCHDKLISQTRSANSIHGKFAYPLPRAFQSLSRNQSVQDL